MRRALAAVDAAPPPGQPAQAAPPAIAEPGAPARFARELAPGPLRVERPVSTDTLYERLGSDDIAQIEERIAATDGLRDLYAATSNEPTRRHLLLAFGLWLGVQSVSEKTGLPLAQPPEEIHSMARGPTAAAGGLYEADLILSALASSGVEAAEVTRALDFGCSSGRVVRVLAASWPHVSWHGCDPNEAAIAWAKRELSGIDFFVNGSVPPLPPSDGQFDLVYAISIWSHFEPQLGLRWFAEMERLLRPGGYLICTTHGMTSIDFYVTRGLRTPQQSDEIAGALYRRGWWYAPEFGEAGDWGVIDPSWGTAFLSPEWLAAQLCPPWRLLEFAPGRNQDNQDVYVLQRA